MRAHADDPPQRSARENAPRERSAREHAPRPVDRPVPDYDGLPEPGDDAGDVLLWTARILTSPLYFISEFLLRRPIGWLITEIERHEVIESLRDFFTFGPNDNIAVYPTAFYEFGFQPSGGIYASWDEFLFPENRISTHAGYGGSDWLSFTLTDRVEIEDRMELGTRVLARRRPDFVFGGIGPYAGSVQRARFGAERVDANLWTSLRYWRSSVLGAEIGYRTIGFIDEGYRDEPSVGERAQQLNESVPYAFDTGYDAIFGELRADVDTRSEGGPPEGGIRFAAHVGEHGAFRGVERFQNWVSWGGSTTLATDVLGQHRVLGVTAETHFITPLEDSNVPFTELVDVGGSAGLLPGFFPGQIRGFSAAGATVHYTWPIWAFLDAHLFVGAANAFGEHLTDFDLELLRLSFGLIFMPRVNGSELPFQLNMAFATDTFDRGADIDSFRFAIGATDVDVL